MLNNTIPTITRESFLSALLAKRAANGAISASALALLQSEKSQAAAFLDFCVAATMRSKVVLSTILAALPDTDKEFLKKHLDRTSPQYAKFRAALAENTDAKFEAFAPLSRTYPNGKQNPDAQFRVTLSGVGRFSETHGAKWWTTLLAIMSNPNNVQRIRDFIAQHPVSVSSSES